MRWIMYNPQVLVWSRLEKWPENNSSHLYIPACSFQFTGIIFKITVVISENYHFNLFSQTLLDCGQKAVEYGGTPRANALIACDCDRTATAPVQDACLSSADCMGTENLALFKDAVKLVSNMNEDHMRYFCDCRDE